MRKVILSIVLLGVGGLSGMFITVWGLSPKHLMVASVAYAAQAYEIGCLKHEMFNPEECVAEARLMFIKHVEIFTK